MLKVNIGVKLHSSKTTNQCKGWPGWVVFVLLFQIPRIFYETTNNFVCSLSDAIVMDTNWNHSIGIWGIATRLVSLCSAWDMDEVGLFECVICSWTHYIAYSAGQFKSKHILLQAGAIHMQLGPLDGAWISDILIKWDISPTHHISSTLPSWKRFSHYEGVISWVEPLFYFRTWPTCRTGWSWETKGLRPPSNNICPNGNATCYM